MKHTEMPATRPATESIIRSFQNSHKRHFIITGSRGTGKSTLFQRLQEHWNIQPGITTKAQPGKCVLLQENNTANQACIGIFDSALLDSTCIASSYTDASRPSDTNRMKPQTEGFLEVGIPALERAILHPSSWVSIDEIGYLESNCPSYQEKLLQLFTAKRVLAVLRKQDTSFLNLLRNRKDVFVYDLDQPFPPIGCVIMASGLGRRFRRNSDQNKLLVPLHGKPLIEHILNTTSLIPSLHRIVVTRHEEVSALCSSQQIPVLLHDLPGRNDTVRLGLETLLETHPHLSGCMFIPGDQPLISRESIETMLLAYSQIVKDNCQSTRDYSQTARDISQVTAPILRLYFAEQAGAPILFDKHYFPELLTLPEGKGGSVLTKKYPEQVHLVPAREAYELYDVDTPEDLLRFT